MPTTTTPAKKATNVTLSADVLAEAKALGIIPCFRDSDTNFQWKSCA